MAYGYVTPTDGFTLETWYWRNSLPTDWVTFFFQGTQAPGGGWSASGRNFIFGMSTAGAMHTHVLNKAGSTLVSTLDPSPSGYGNDSQWHHVAYRMAADKKTWHIFLDGEVLQTGVLATAIDWDPGVLTVGAEAAPHRGVWGRALWDQRLAYSAVYDKALTDSRIFEHYTAGNGGTVYYGDDEVARLHRICDWADIPEQARKFEPAITTLQGIEVAGANALDRAQETVESTQGVLFADGQSKIVYHNRKHRYNRFLAATLKESTQSAPEVDFEFSVDDTWVYNDIRGSRPFGATIRFQNQESRAEHGRKVYKFEMSVTSDRELRNAVTWFAARYGDDRPRISAVKFSSIGSELIKWLTAGGVQIGDSIEVDEMAQFAPRTTMRFIIESLHLDANFVDKTWNMTMALSPYEINEVFQIGLTELGAGAYLAF